MKKKLFLGLLAAAAVTFTACQKDETLGELNQKQAIDFGTYVGRDAQTKASITEISNMKNDNYNGFGVFAYYTANKSFDYDGDDQDSNPDYQFMPAFMNNEVVKYSTSTDNWAYNTKYWPGTTEQDKLSFFAYAPYNGDGITNLPTVSTTGQPTLTFEVQNNVTAQYDLLYATPIMDTYYDDDNNAGTVTLNFNHALSRIGFKAATATTDYKVTITNITITGNFNTSGTLNLDSGEWTSTNPTNDKNYAFTSFANAATELINTTAQNIMTDNGYLMVIPAEEDNYTVKVTYNYQYKVSEDVFASEVIGVTQTGTVENLTLAKGKAYTLSFSLNPTNTNEETGQLLPINFNVTLNTDWGDPTEGTVVF